MRRWKGRGCGDGSRNGSAREGVAGGACFGRSVGSKQLGNGAVTSVAGENHRRGEESDNTDGCAAGPLYHQKGDGGLRATSPRPLLCVQASDAPASMDNGSCSCSWQSVGTSCRNEDDSKIYGIPRLPTGGQGKWTQPRDFGRGRNGIGRKSGNDVAGEARLSTALPKSMPRNDTLPSERASLTKVPRKGTD